MQIKLNEDSIKALAAAKEKALKLQYPELGAEHILMGILSIPSPLLTEALEALQIKAEKLSMDIESNMPSGPGVAGKGELPLARSAKEIFHAASMEAQAHHADELAPEHIMLGILNVVKSAAFSLFKGATAGREDKIRAELKGCQERLRKRRSMTALFNEQASTAIITARDEAAKSRSEYIEPAHILLGIIGHPGSVAMAALLRLKVNMKTLNPNLQRIIAELPKKKSKEAGQSFSDAAKRVMDKTVEASELMKHKYIGPEHFLLGIMSLEGTLAHKALKEAGAPDFKQVKEEVQMVLAAHK